MTYSVLVRCDDKSQKIEEYIRKNIKYSYSDDNPDIVILSPL